MSWILSLQSYMFGDNQEAVVEAEEVRAEEEEEEQEQGEVEYKVCFFFMKYNLLVSGSTCATST